MDKKYLYTIIGSIVILCISCTQDLNNATASYSGIVKDAHTGEVFPYLNVKITDGVNVHVSTKTDSEGSFLITAKVNEIDNSYYLQISDATCELKKIKLPGYASGITDMGIIEVEGPSVPTAITVRTEVKEGVVLLEGEVSQEAGLHNCLEIIERGFCLGKSSEEERKISCGKGVGAFSAKIPLQELEISTTYYVRAYALNEQGVGYSNSTSFDTTDGLPAVKLFTTTKDLKSTSVILGGKLIHNGGHEVTERGVCWNTFGSPSIDDNCKFISGQDTTDYWIQIDELAPKTKYYVKAYAKNKAGISYSSNQVYFTTNYISGGVKLVAIDSLDLYNRTIKAYGEVTNIGDPPYIEKGFVYSHIVNTPTINGDNVIVTGIGDGAFSGTLTNLSLGKTYYVRAYIKMATNDVVYSSNHLPFKTNTELGEVEMVGTAGLNLSLNTIIAEARIINEGKPVYTEVGFAYGKTLLPEISDNFVKASDVDDNIFRAELTGLEHNVSSYYVRAYIKGEWGIMYSLPIAFNTRETLPAVKTLPATNENESSLSATLHGDIIDAGNPSYTERGFVWSSKYDTPTIEDHIIHVEGDDIGVFEARIVLPSKTTTAVRAYAKNSKGISYGNTIYIFNPQYPYVELPIVGLSVHKTDVSSGEVVWETAKQLCENSTLGGFSDWRLPTLEELTLVYYEMRQGNLSGFQIDTRYHYSYYWSSSELASNDGYYYVINTYDGDIATSYRNGSNYARCVRTLTK